MGYPHHIFSCKSILTFPSLFLTMRHTEHHTSTLQYFLAFAILLGPFQSKNSNNDVRILVFQHSNLLYFCNLDFDKLDARVDYAQDNIISPVQEQGHSSLQNMNSEMMFVESSHLLEDVVFHILWILTSFLWTDSILVFFEPILHWSM